MLITDGDTGLLAALPFIYPRIPLQRCWAHKTRNVCNYVRKKDHAKVRASLRAISHADGLMAAQRALGRFKTRWQEIYPKAVACLLRDEEALFALFQITDTTLWPQIQTTNAIERRFREVRRRTRPMGVFSDRTSMERILYAIFSYENAEQGTGTPFLVLTQNS
jgi:transposase-like protein